MPPSDSGWTVVREPHTDRVIEGVIHKYVRDLQGDLIDVGALEKRMPEIAQNAAIIYKHGHDPQRGVVPLGNICAWKRSGDEIHIRASINKGNEIVDDIWKEEMVPMGTRAGFSIGGGTRKEAKACRMEAGRRHCDISDVIICEVSWTPNPANPGALLRWGNWMAKEETPEKTDKAVAAGAILGSIASGVVGAVAGAKGSATQGSTKVGEEKEEKSGQFAQGGAVSGESSKIPKGEYNLDPKKIAGDQEEKNIVKTDEQAGGKASYVPSDSRIIDPATQDRYHEDTGRPKPKPHEVQKAEGPASPSKPFKMKIRDVNTEFNKPEYDHTTEGMIAHMRAGGKLPPIKVSRQGYLHDGRHRLAAHKYLDQDEIDAEYDEPSEKSLEQKCGCKDDDCDDCKKRKLNKANTDGYESALTRLYCHIPSRVVAEEAIQGCGTCDDYVTHLVRNCEMPLAKAMLKLQNVLDSAYSLSQKTVKDKEKELPKETDETMTEKDVAQKSMEERLAALEKQIADLVSAKKEGGGFAPAAIGSGPGPLAGVQGSTPENIDATLQSTTKDVFAKDEAEALVKLVKAGYKVEGFQKGTPEVPPKQGSSPSGIEGPVVQKMKEELPLVRKAVEAWASQ